MPYSVSRVFSTVVLSALLVACGGGGDPSPDVTSIQPESLKYGQKAVIYVLGKYLRNDMLAETGSCTNPSYSANSAPDAAILNCTVTATGSLPITIRRADGVFLFSTTLTVPEPQVTLATSLGNIVVELNPEAAPATVNNFLNYIYQSYYNGTLFHRVIPNFVIQGGGYTTGLEFKVGKGNPIALESNKGLSNVRGSIAMARTQDPNSATSEFFVNVLDNPSLDYQSPGNPGYAVFGRVVQGMDVVDAIAAVQTTSMNGFTDVPTTDVTIKVAVQSK